MNRLKSAALIVLAGTGAFVFAAGGGGEPLAVSKAEACTDVHAWYLLVCECQPGPQQFHDSCTKTLAWKESCTVEVPR